ncbi:hypothetical protein E0Z10_g3267 [Xylaria hypoxylon]|uniref:Uncharacterized protein n=1 Tax=Xylaria hypoxylon TaxID=37992 RepID=A0A4Z0Z1W0_9PEZI|nr:hypothetical protein E0Z10_g3267 [Xylaria hypoxylon]
MEVVDKKEESASSTKVAIEFYFYQRLPPELKLKIWEKVFEDWSPGAHWFYLIIRPRDPTRLTVVPDKYQKDDVSAWRQRRALSRIDKYSFDGLLKFERTAATLYKETSGRHTVRVEENGIAAMVDGRTDLINFRLRYGFTLASISLLSIKANSGVFANITQIAIEGEFFFYSNWRTRNYQPFVCSCPVPDPTHSQCCPIEFIRFIRFFKDLKVFYLVLPVTQKNLRSRLGIPENLRLPRELPRLCHTSNGMSQLGLNVFRRLQEIAQQEGLSQFYDRRGTYCEVLREHLIQLFRSWISTSIDELKAAWGRYKQGRNIEFKVAVWADLRGVTVMPMEEDSTIANDLFVAVQLVARKPANQLVKAWFYVPIGIVAILATSFGINKLLQLGAISFPASVACLVILFISLLLLEQIIGENKTRRIIAVIEIPGGWSLRWINIFFTPSFVLLPLSPSIGSIEVLKIIAVFVLGFLVMMALAAYMTRGLQLMLGSSKRAMIERAEELGDSRISARASGSREPSQDYDGRQAHFPVQIPVPPSRATRWALIISSRLDMIIYALIFTFVGVPIYYTVGYAMPLQLTFAVLTYFAAMSFPPNWRQYLHPVLVSSLFTVLGFWVLALIKDHSLDTTLREFRTGATYLELWDGTHELPGARDIFASVLDAGIVSLALPMYQYRRELKQHFLSIVLPNVLISIGSLFAYPYICFVIGISAQRSLAFAGRSLTLALATPAVANLGGDSNTVAALAITSGIVGALIGQRMLGLLRIPEDDYVTRGVTLGANSSAIATALLLRTDPRAAALSSLSMSLFGAITVLFTSVPPIVAVIRSLVQL